MYKSIAIVALLFLLSEFGLCKVDSSSNSKPVPATRVNDDYKDRFASDFDETTESGNLESINFIESDDDDDVIIEDSIAANIKMTSDYLNKGITQTEHRPAVQGGFDWVHPSGAYLGLWGSSIYSSESTASMEVNWLSGYSYKFSENFLISLGLAYFVFPGDTVRNSWEIPFKIEWKQFKFEVDYDLSWNDQPELWYLNVGWERQIFFDFKIGAFIGYSKYLENTGIEGSTNYSDYRLSLSREFQGVDWSISDVFVMQDSSKEEYEMEQGHRLIFSIAKTF